MLQRNARLSGGHFLRVFILVNVPTRRCAQLITPRL